MDSTRAGPAKHGRDPQNGNHSLRNTREPFWDLTDHRDFLIYSSTHILIYSSTHFFFNSSSQWTTSVIGEELSSPPGEATSIRCPSRVIS